jgi:hypothetical protein
MEELIKSVVCAECEEYGRASAKFGAVNNSDHESYAVLREEADEAADALEDVDALMNVFFEMVKNNEEDKVKLDILNVIKHRAEEAAAESIQAAAMARKAIETIQRRASK